jgi:hypothetical protein
MVDEAEAEKPASAWSDDGPGIIESRKAAAKKL